MIIRDEHVGEKQLDRIVQQKLDLVTTAEGTWRVNADKQIILT